MIKKTDEENLKHENADLPCDEPKTKKTTEFDESTWAADQKKRSYYYDDAHGYEIYDPETDDEEDED